MIAIADLAAVGLDRSAPEAEVGAARAVPGDGGGRDEPAAFPVTSLVSGPVLKVSRTDVEITSGLAIGAMVVLHPGDSVTDGVKFSIRHWIRP